MFRKGETGHADIFKLNPGGTEKRHPQDRIYATGGTIQIVMVPDERSRGPVSGPGASSMGIDPS